MSDEKFLEKYEELLNKDYCNCNEMNCIDNNSPRRILNIAKKQKEVLDKIKEYLEELLSDTKGIINDLEYHKEAHKKELELLYDDKDIFNNILELLEEIE